MINARPGSRECCGWFALAPNLASSSNGAKVVSSTNPNAEALLDDTEASSWKSGRGGDVVVELAQPATVTSVQVSAYTTTRFEGLKAFTLQSSTDGVNWSTLRSGEAFSSAAPRPTAPDLHHRTFELPTPTKAKFVRYWADEALGETKTAVQSAGRQPTGDVAQGVTGVEFANACVMPPRPRAPTAGLPSCPTASVTASTPWRSPVPPLPGPTTWTSTSTTRSAH